MEKVCVFLADGFEEGEALIPVDLLRRAGAEVTTASISTSLCVQGSHGITVTADALAENVPLEEYGMVVLPGGLGAAIPFGLALVGHIAGQAESARIQEAIVYMH